MRSRKGKLWDNCIYILDLGAVALLIQILNFAVSSWWVEITRESSTHVADVIQFYRRQKAVQRLLAKELEKEKVVEKKRGKRTKGEDARSCKPATRYPHTSKSESPCESVSCWYRKNQLLLFRQVYAVSAFFPCDVCISFEC